MYTIRDSFTASQAFLEAHDFTQPGCLVLDVDMPDMNGLELQEILAARGLRLPVIFATGRSDGAARTRALKRGAVGFIEKPFPRQVLLDHIKTAFGFVSAPEGSQGLSYAFHSIILSRPHLGGARLEKEKQWTSKSK